MKLTKCAIAVSLSLSILGSEVVAAPIFRIIDIGKLGSKPDETVMQPYDINNKGVVVGGSSAFPGAFIWSQSTGTQPLVLNRRRGKVYVGASAINDRGDFAGSVVPQGEEFKAVVVKHQGREMIPYLEGTWAEYRPSPIKMTNAGTVLGVSEGFNYWLWSEGTGVSALDLNSAYSAYDINDHNQVVGTYVGTRAFMYDVPNKKLHIIPYLPGVLSHRATAINNAAQMVGAYETETSSSALPFIWTETDGFKPLPGVGHNQEEFRPTDINDSSQVVGYFSHSWSGGEFERSIFYWDPETAQVIDLERLIDPDDPLAKDVVLRPYDFVVDVEQRHIPRINNRGEIVAPGLLRSENRGTPDHTFVLVPISK